MGSALGVLLVVLLNRFLDGNRAARIDNKSDVIRALERDHQPLNAVSISVLDLAGARSLRDFAGYLIGPPGWSPDGSRLTTDAIKADWRTRQGQKKQAAE